MLPQHTAADTHDHSCGLALSSWNLLVCLIKHQVEEHVETAQNAGYLSSALDVDEQAAVHEFCCQLCRGM